MGLDAVAGQFPDQALQVVRVSGDQGDGVSGGAEAAGGGEPQAGAAPTTA